MTTVNPVYNNTLEEEDRSVKNMVWSLTSANSDGYPAELPSFGIMTWQYYGAWGTATLQLEGSNDAIAKSNPAAATWFPLTRIYPGTAATATANGGVSTNENPRFVRPNLSIPGAGATLTVSLVAIRGTPVRT